MQQQPVAVAELHRISVVHVFYVRTMPKMLPNWTWPVMRYAISAYNAIYSAAERLNFCFQVIFVAECSPPNTDYMYGKQGLHKGLVPRAFLEILDDDE